MTVPKLPAVSFADETGYDSDEFENDTFSNASSSSSGVILGFDDGELAQVASQEQQQQQTDSNAIAYEDEANLTISRIGGRSYFPLEERQLPPLELTRCPLCSASMPLLVQIYAPLQSDKVTPLSPPHPINRYRDEFDRLLYVFGCVKKGCIGVRCLRAAQRSPKWARDGREKRRKAKADAEAAKQKASENPFAANPFTTSALNPSSNPFASSGAVDFGSMIFGGEATTEAAPSLQKETVADAAPASQPDTQGDEVAEGSTSSTLWTASDLADIVPPRYLATDSERLSTVPTSRQAKVAKQLASMSLENSADGDKESHKGGRANKTRQYATSSSSTGGAGGDNEGWSAEAYEIMRLSGVEEVFLAFQERLEASDAAEQVVRYEFGGTPLPYSGKSKPYNTLWLSAPLPGQSSAVTRTSYAPVSQQTHFKRYDTSCRNIPKCVHCNSQRTFEMQLMPNLVTIVEKGLQRQNAGKSVEKELGWATLWCYVCSADCLDARDGGNDLDDDGKQLDWQAWREEVALVELED
ncbi:hypothetical protein P389DRAFT_205183 [Cystobasidium minutum MCA 4210]|uniref:uncharacterized protein n=1 Tax=Cystobasidium minutum MCA 4210 TaxID=1397322 RepID=UPI0034CDD18D|eukprot:jgi/Rhomi1/205183/MIX6012_202_85